MSFPPLLDRCVQGVLSACGTGRITCKPDNRKVTPERAHQAPGLAKPAPELAEPASDKPNDLTLVEGIGPKIAGVLRDEGIDTFDRLGKTTPDRLTDILRKAGNRYRMHDASTWPMQARLAADGRMTELAALKLRLKGGRAN